MREMEEDRPEEPAEPAEKPVEAAEPAEPAGPVEPAGPAEPPVEPPTPKPKTVRIRKPKAATAPSIVMPEIDDRFWANLLRTQREAERATKLQRISEFNLL